MTAASAQPPSYHLLGRDGRYRWWRPILEIVLAGLFGLLGLLLLVVVMPPVQGGRLGRAGPRWAKTPALVDATAGR